MKANSYNLKKYICMQNNKKRRHPEPTRLNIPGRTLTCAYCVHASMQTTSVPKGNIRTCACNIPGVLVSDQFQIFQKDVRVSQH